jgi:hypothetical protein
VIKVLRLGQPVQQVYRNGSRTIGDLLNGIGQNLAPGEEVRFNNAPANAQTPLQTEDGTIMIVPAVKGGR